MKEYIEKILHQEVQVEPYTDIQRLPLSYKNRYDLKRMIIGDKEALLAAPLGRVPLVTLRKQQHQMVIYTGMPCVLYLTDMNYYTRDALLNEGVPFVWEGHQIYLPFIGTLLNDHQRKIITTHTQMSYLTQKMLLSALYQGWEKATVTKVSEMLSVSKMSITRCFDEMEALGIPYLTTRSRARSITADKDKKVMWEAIRPFLRDPVIKTFALKEEPDIALPLSGTHALAYYSMLDEGPYPIIAVTKKQLADVNISDHNLTPAGEVPGCILQEIGYYIGFENGTAVDPLTVVLSISEEEMSDPRVSMAVDEMLEGYVL